MTSSEPIKNVLVIGVCHSSFHSLSSYPPSAHQFPRTTSLSLTPFQASGILGPHLLRALSSPSENFNLTILTRPKSSSSSGPSSSPNTQTVELATPYTSSSLAPVLQGQDAVINLSPPYDLAQHELVIEESIKAGVKRYIPPDFGARSDVQAVLDVLPLIEGKKGVRDVLARKVEGQAGSTGGGMSWTSVLPGGFIDWFVMSAPFSTSPIGFGGA